MQRVQLTTLTSLRRQKGIPDGTDFIAPNDDDSRLTDCITAASGWIADHTFGRSFVPVQDTRYFRIEDINYHKSSTPLTVGDDLLEVVNLYNGNGTLMANTTYDLMPVRGYPKSEIELVYGGGSDWTFANRSSKGTLAAFFGYHPDYANAWASASSLVGTLSASDIKAVVYTYANYEVGEYVQLTTSGTQEIAQISAIGTVAGSAVGTLTLTRGVNGTDGLAHGTLTEVKRYQYPPEIQRTCNDLAVFYWDNRDSVESSIQVAELALKIENKIPGRIYTAVQYYARSRYEATENG